MDNTMNNAVYKTIEVVGTSKTSMEDAVDNAIRKTAQTVDNLRWFHITDTRGYVEAQKIAYWQVTVKIGFHVTD
jgi:hypothetical protein